MPGDAPGDGLRMYHELADWFHLLTAPADYADEAAFILGLLRERVAARSRRCSSSARAGATRPRTCAGTCA